MKTRKKMKILVIGFHGCLVTPFAEDKSHFFSQQVLKRVTEEKYDGFVGMTPYSSSNVVGHYEHNRNDFRHELEDQKPDFHISNLHDIVNFKKVDFDNLYVYKVNENFERVSSLPSLAVSCAEEVKSEVKPNEKLEVGFAQLKEVERAFEKEHKNLGVGLPIKAISESIPNQLLDVALFLRATFPYSEISVDFINTKRYSTQAMRLPPSKLPEKMEIQVLAHDTLKSYQEGFTPLGKLTHEKLSLHKQSIFRSSNDYRRLPEEEIEETSCCFCLPWRS